MEGEAYRLDVKTSVGLHHSLLTSDCINTKYLLGLKKIVIKEKNILTAFRPVLSPEIVFYIDYKVVLNDQMIKQI